MKTITVTAHVLPGKADHNAEADFANCSRADQYAAILKNSGDYCAVYVRHGDDTYEYGV